LRGFLYDFRLLRSNSGANLPHNPCSLVVRIPPPHAIKGPSKSSPGLAPTCSTR
jgi:hypothetical protein